MAQPGFIIETRYNFPRVPWDTLTGEGEPFNDLTLAVTRAAELATDSPKNRYRVLYRTRYSSNIVAVPPEAFEFDAELKGRN